MCQGSWVRKVEQKNMRSFCGQQVLRARSRWLKMWRMRFYSRKGVCHASSRTAACHLIMEATMDVLEICGCNHKGVCHAISQTAACHLIMEAAMDVLEICGCNHEGVCHAISQTAACHLIMEAAMDVLEICGCNHKGVCHAISQTAACPLIIGATMDVMEICGCNQKVPRHTRNPSTVLLLHPMGVDLVEIFGWNLNKVGRSKVMKVMASRGCMWVLRIHTRQTAAEAQLLRKMRTLLWLVPWVFPKWWMASWFLTKKISCLHQGSWNIINLGGSNVYKCMVILREFPSLKCLMLFFVGDEKSLEPKAFWRPRMPPVYHYHAWQQWRWPRRGTKCELRQLFWCLFPYCWWKKSQTTTWDGGETL